MAGSNSCFLLLHHKIITEQVLGETNLLQNSYRMTLLYVSSNCRNTNFCNTRFKRKIDTKKLVNPHGDWVLPNATIKGDKMAKEYQSIDDLCAAVQKDIDSVLKQEVSKVVSQTHSDTVSRMVYHWEPRLYGRRGEQGGLSDESNYKTTVLNGALLFENNTPFNYEYGGSNRGSLIGLIEYGEGFNGNHYDYPFGDHANTFMQPRPVMQETKKEVQSSGLVTDALIGGIKARGYEVE